MLVINSIPVREFHQAISVLLFSMLTVNIRTSNFTEIRCLSYNKVLKIACNFIIKFIILLERKRILAT
jgi:hypothetical protein